MAVLIYIEGDENRVIKKSFFELASYGKSIADSLNSDLVAFCLNCDNIDSLGDYGVSKALQFDYDKSINISTLASNVSEEFKTQGCDICILSNSTNSMSIAPIIASNSNSAYTSNVKGLPDSFAPLRVPRSSFSNKATQTVELNSEKKVFSISKNFYGLKENKVEISIESKNFSNDSTSDKTLFIKKEKNQGSISISDAEVVVSAGRGMKGPENWGIIEELATELNAALACSKPVSDMGWRPHSEHVGQTGKPVATNLYIAIGISGAIQHLAGINSSKHKLVINKDSEAPFFKVANYAVVGDAFEIVPKLIEAVKAYKSNN